MAWCTYTDPEVAQTGLSEREARERGIAVDSFTVRLADLDRAVTDHRTDGFVTVHTRKGTATIVGATIAGPRASVRARRRGSSEKCFACARRWRPTVRRQLPGALRPASRRPSTASAPW